MNKQHVQHEAASRYWEEQATKTLAFCRVTSLDFLRLSTYVRIIVNPLGRLEAWGAI